ncbi:unnamed protein product [Didymodactylos carnosus]|uniref:Uncharacterized protein n=1 Tax=Didymodactylos carnosus TaxID=1234261 RepID=A0A8S2T4T0_9BILA|nr:unnamed protein product [Didymodactylos carnosus]CAF4240533.1 unnamed protein product [Didymodactylos carnosus]
MERLLGSRYVSTLSGAEVLFNTANDLYHRLYGDIENQDYFANQREEVQVGLVFLLTKRVERGGLSLGINFLLRVMLLLIRLLIQSSVELSSIIRDCLVGVCITNDVQFSADLGTQLINEIVKIDDDRYLKNEEYIQLIKCLYQSLKSSVEDNRGFKKLVTLFEALEKKLEQYILRFQLSVTVSFTSCTFVHELL